jgi:UPF0042 nucleotide-binding protein
MTEPTQITDRPQVLVVTGMSGAGRSTAAKVLEDLEYTVIDNLPPQLISQAVDHHEVTERRRRLAVVIDSRGGLPLEALESARDDLGRQGIRVAILFLDSEDQVLIHRYEENRRPHPVRADSVAEAIGRERKMLAELRETADFVVDTSDLSVHQLRGRIVELFSEAETRPPMRVAVTSFGYKHGIPRDVDLLFDVRFLPNPHWVPELRPLVGTDPPVREYVLGQPEARQFLDKVEDLLSFLIPRYQEEGKSYLSIGLGCTGGRHRSVALAVELAGWLGSQGIAATVRHRDAAE